MEKTGQDEGLPRPDPLDEASPMYWGTLLEPIVAAHYTRRTGRRVRRINAVLQHPDCPWMLANIDREILGDEAVQILECKTAGLHGAKLWEQGVPEYVQLQVLHQMAVTGKRAADVAVLICGQELQIHRIERNDTMIRQLMALEHAFWAYVEEMRAPPADGSESAGKALCALYPRDTGQELDLTADAPMNAAFCDLVAVRRVLAEHLALEGGLKQRIQQRMGEATRAIFEGGAVSWKRSKEGNSFDLGRLLREHPEYATAYAQVTPGSRRFLVDT